MTYEERVRRIAEEMAERVLGKTEDGKSWLNEIYTYEDREGEIQYASAYARIAVAKMAEAATEFLGSLSEYSVQKRLTEYGLIPDKTGAKDAL